MKPFGYKTATVDQFLDLLEMGATLLPSDGALGMGFQVGRWRYWVSAEVDAWSDAQCVRFHQLYYGSRIRFGYPGDFHVMPECMAGLPLRTRRATPVFDLVETPADVCNREWTLINANLKNHRGDKPSRLCRETSRRKSKKGVRGIWR